jgi:large subunit ribosomal protein L17
MRHGYFGKKLSRTKNERRRLLVGLARELIKRGSIKTTLARARAVRPLVESLVAKAKRGKERLLFKELADKEVVKLLLRWAPARWGSRTSGFTRLVRLGSRRGDATEEVLLSFVDPAPAPTEKPAVKEEKPSKEEKAVKAKKPEIKRKVKSK